MTGRPCPVPPRRGGFLPGLSRSLAAASAAVVMGCAANAPPAATTASPGQPAPRGYYLSLGDSLSVGDQPDAQGVTLPTSQGYPDQLAAMLSAGGHPLSLVKLGCPGETTATMRNGGICGYTRDERTSLTGNTGSQLAAAVSFLREHRGHVPLITIDIGANDLNGCVALGSISLVAACARPVIATVGRNTAAILAELRAADPDATITGMTYYVPELAAWLTGPPGQRFAAGSVTIARALNAALTADFTAAHAQVAGVFTAFRSDDLASQAALPGFGLVPRAVALVCQWTWACTAPPAGPNEHANTAGYGVIARAFAAVLPARLALRPAPGPAAPQ